MKMKLLMILPALPVLCVLVVAVVFVAVCICARAPRRRHEADCLIVLGARLNPDGSLKRTLRLRCDAAYDAWKQGIARRIIVCGGQMKDEPRPHSEAMRDYLLQLGVPEGDILVENESLYTVQNFRNAAVIMEHRGFRRAAVVTSDYHLTRALWIAHNLGMHAWGIPAPTPCTAGAYLRTRTRETISWFLYFIYGINRDDKK